VIPQEVIAQKIVERYSHPSRTAYLYFFVLRPDANRAILIPHVGDVLYAWVDEGHGLVQKSPAEAVASCKTADSFRLERPMNPQQRRMQMARVVTISLEQQAPDQVLVDLYSRAIAFTPKGDRHVLEIWRPAEGSWYSAPIGRE
jgi:hypothetical protein